MTTSATARPPRRRRGIGRLVGGRARSLPRWRSWPARSSGNAISGIGTRSSSFFSSALDREFPAPLELHLVLDNYGTHKKDKVRAWLQKHPRFVLHFIPTSSSWLNLVERWFGELTQKAIRCGIFPSLCDLKQAIEAYLESWNEDPNPFVWTATAASIWAKITKCRDVLEKVQPGCTQPKKRKPPADHV